MDNLITTDDVRDLWTMPNGKRPCLATIWHRRRRGQIPEPVRVGNTNLYNRADVIRLRNQALGIQ